MVSGLVTVNQGSALPEASSNEFQSLQSLHIFVCSTMEDFFSPENMPVLVAMEEEKPQDSHQILPLTTLDFFCPRSFRSAVDLQQLQFKPNLQVLDTKGFQTTKEGVDVLLEKLKPVQTIRALRLTGKILEEGDMKMNTISTEVKRMCDCLLAKNGVELLEIDYNAAFAYGKRALPATVVASAKMLFLSASLVSDYLSEMRWSALEFLDLGDPFDDPNQLLEMLNRILPNTCTVHVFNKCFKLPEHSALNTPLPTFESVTIHRLSSTSASTARSMFCGPFSSIETVARDHAIRGADDQRKLLHLHNFLKEPGFQGQLDQINVAILDTGIDKNHPEFTNGVIADGQSFVPFEHWDTDTYGHGTHCAGILGGNNVGISRGVKLYIGKVLDSTGHGTNQWIADGVGWAVQKKVHIISISAGGPEYSESLWKAIMYAIYEGIIVICAVGNAGSLRRFNIAFPASMDGVLRVGSVNPWGGSSAFSSIGGAEIDAVWFGEDILSSIPNGQYMKANGTSMAAPALAAVCAILLAYDRLLHQPNKKITNTHIMKRLLGHLSFDTPKKEKGLTQLGLISRVPKAFTDHLDEIYGLST